VKSKFSIREEVPSDKMAIFQITEAAFRGRPYAGGDEQDLIDGLRACGALSLSLVILDREDVIGQVTFSPAGTGDDSGPWFALGPVSVIPDRQSQKIGSELIIEGLARIEAMGALGCILTGDPAYYKRFGFEFSPKNVPVNEPEEFFMLKLFGDNKANGMFAFHEAFYGEA
jgi:putative acetyltransferase